MRRDIEPRDKAVPDYRFLTKLALVEPDSVVEDTDVAILEVLAHNFFTCTWLLRAF